MIVLSHKTNERRSSVEPACHAGSISDWKLKLQVQLTWYNFFESTGEPEPGYQSQRAWIGVRAERHEQPLKFITTPRTPSPPSLRVGVTAASTALT